MNSKTILLKSFGLSYEILGNGEEIWFAFHGFGQSAKVFRHLCTPQRTIYSFNLFFHSPTAHAFSLAAWLAKMKQLVNTLQTKRFHIIGFSIGCRPALQLANSLLHEHITINKLILIAPEVLAVSNWYRFATQTKVGNALLNNLSKAAFLQEMVVYVAKKLLNASTHRLIEQQIKYKMNLVAKTWLAYREFELSREELHQLSQRIVITVIASEEDKLIRFSRLIKNCTVFSMTCKTISVPHERLLNEATKILRDDSYSLR